MTCLLLAPVFLLHIFLHHKASACVFATLPWRHKRIKTPSVGMDCYFLFGYFCFCIFNLSGPEPSGERKLQSSNMKILCCIFEFKPFCISFWVCCVIRSFHGLPYWYSRQVGRSSWTLKRPLPHQQTITKTTPIDSTK